MWITRVSIANPVFAVMVMVALCVLGLFAFVRLGVEQMPDVSPPGAYVEVLYPGASPEAVEREITKPIESAVNSIAGVRRIMSRSLEGKSQTNVEFSLNADMSRAMQEVRDRLSAVQGGLPRDAKPPTVARFNNDNAQPRIGKQPQHAQRHHHHGGEHRVVDRDARHPHGVPRFNAGWPRPGPTPPPP